jgi:thymidylate kinase
MGDNSQGTPPKTSPRERECLKELSSLKPNRNSIPIFPPNDPNLFELVFVNRENIAYKVAGALVDSPSYDHGLLVHIGQHNGSGKTTFIRNFKRIMDQQNLWEQLKHDKPSSAGVIQNLEKAIYVEVRCNGFEYHDTSLLNIFILLTCVEIGEKHLRQKLYVKYLLMAIRENFALSDQITPETCGTIPIAVRALLKFHPNSTFLIHWDKVESIKRLYKSGSKKPSFIEEMQRYYELWEELKVALKSEKCFHILTSKSTAFSMIGLQLIRDVVVKNLPV